MRDNAQEGRLRRLEDWRPRNELVLQNIPIEQDRRSIELRFGTMLGFKQFRHASIRGYRTRRTANNRFVVAVEGQLHAMDFDSTPRRVTANRNENATRRLSKLQAKTACVTRCYNFTFVNYH